ncbi:MAG TPA: hypothetical protein VHE79_09185 [Spirochaetia bacterium]
MKLTVFSPHPDDATSSNNASIVVRVEAGGLSVLFSGDCEASRWESICRYFGEGGTLRSDILVAPHHGSRDAISEEALRCIQPRHIAISAGRDNSYGHPHEEALHLYARYGTVRITTGGTIRYKYESVLPFDLMKIIGVEQFDMIPAIAS